MSFLRTMFSGSVKSEDPRRFLVEAMLSAMEADGEITVEEMTVLQGNLEGHDLFEGLSGEETSRLVDLAADAIRSSGGGGERLKAIAKGMPSRSHRLAAYTLACQVCVSDAELAESEIRYLDSLQSALGIADDEAKELFEASRASSGLQTLEEKAARMREIMPLFVDCMALMASADDEIHFEELIGIREVLRNIPDFAVLSGADMDQAIEASLARVKGASAEAELDIVAQTIVEQNDRYWTTVYMMVVALADGKADWREVTFLKKVAQTFELSDDQMDQAMETASMFPTPSAVSS